MIDLSGNPLDPGITELAEHLNCLSELIALGLGATEMGKNQVSAVARCLPSLSKLQKIDLSGNELRHSQEANSENVLIFHFLKKL